MSFRWIHNIWKYLWKIFWTIIIVVIVFLLCVMVALQLDVTQDYLTNRMEQAVQKKYKAHLSIGDVGGFLPFSVRLDDVVLTGSDSTRADTLAKVSSIQSRIQLWGLLHNKIRISSLSVDQPFIRLKKNEQGRIKFLQKKPQPKQAKTDSSGNSWVTGVEVLAPTIQINGGQLLMPSPESKKLKLPNELNFSDINANFYFEWTQNKRYFDIESFSTQIKDVSMDHISLSGQVYSEHDSLEFNSFHLGLGKSKFVLNGRIDDIQPLEPHLREQFLTARYNLSVISNGIYPRQFHQTIPAVPNSEGPFTLQLQTKGTADSLQVSRAAIGTGDSRVSLNGLFQHLRSRNNFAYHFKLDTVLLKRKDIRRMFDSLSTSQYQALEDLAVSGQVSGTIDSVDADLGLSSPLGKFDVQGQSQLKRPYRYAVTMGGQNVDLSFLSSDEIDTTSLNFDARAHGYGFNLKHSYSKLTANFHHSKINHIVFDTLKFTSLLDHGVWMPEYDYKNGEASISGSGRINFNYRDTNVSLEGKARKVDLSTFSPDSLLAATQLNFDYDVDMQSLNLNRMQGRANLDVEPSIIGKDTVKAHQFYMDLNSPDEQRRIFRLTSSLFDMTVQGQIAPGEVVQEAKFWSSYLRNRIRGEMLLKDVPSPGALPHPQAQKTINLNGIFEAKDLSLIKKYIPSFPAIYTDSRLTFSANTDGDKLLFSAEMHADTLFYNKVRLTNVQSQLSSSFRSSQTLKQFSNVDFKIKADTVKTSKADLDSLTIGFAMNQDSVNFHQRVGSISNSAKFNMDLTSTLADSAVSVDVKNFYLGNNNYAWTQDGKPSLQYTRTKKTIFHDFSFHNGDALLQLAGILSSSREDSLNYVVKNVELSRISDLLKTKINFAGTLNGDVTTRALTTKPSIQGGLNVDQFELNDRLVGDLNFNSTYNKAKDRFDTKVKILTDSTKYRKYLQDNDNIGQNITLTGYIKPPKMAAPTDSLYHFNADFKQIDMWVVSLLVGNVFLDMEGQATGKGYIGGNMDDFDFHADFQTKNVYAKPNFMKTNYFMNGHVAVDRHKGIVFDNIDIQDTKGGTGVLDGTIDLNNFNPVKYFDITLKMNHLKFLNNDLTPGVPFYGDVSGTGKIKLSGSNASLFLESESPIQVAQSSVFALPLLSQTEVSEDHKFIRFVTSFKHPFQAGKGVAADTTDSKKMRDYKKESKQQSIADLSFSERFDLNLQFVANNNITAKLVFDPVTGEVLSADGTGRLRITMQDQDLQMFGSFNVERGNYDFVTSEIISRKLQLEPGGTIVWEGPPDNARLNIDAVYHARPLISPIITGKAPNPDKNGGKHVPIDLVVEITGTIQTVENNYYFRLPNTLNITSASTLSYTISEINRSNQQKFLQAISILATGQFLPTQGAGSGVMQAQTLGIGSTVVNPLLSNQVISPLLSDQINALINSDVTQFDVDFNLNAYNEIDLGLAVRFYNDKLVLRHEGQITGESESNFGDRIGDLSATYRIRPGLSLEIFHRQDQILNTLGATSQARDVTPNVDGVGLEAKLEFNSWKALPGKFKRILGGNNKGVESTEEPQDQEQK